MGTRQAEKTESAPAKKQDPTNRLIQRLRLLQADCFYNGLELGAVARSLSKSHREHDSARDDTASEGGPTYKGTPIVELALAELVIANDFILDAPPIDLDAIKPALGRICKRVPEDLRTLQQAQRAIQDGGADPLNKALSPGTAARSVELLIRIRRTIAATVWLAGAGRIPDSVAAVADQLTEDSAYYKRVWEELVAANKIRGLTSPPDPDDVQQAAWFKTATSEAVYPQLLARARNDGRLAGTKRGSRWYYSVDAVAQIWPEYRQQLDAAANET